MTAGKPIQRYIPDDLDVTRQEKLAVDEIWRTRVDGRWRGVRVGRLLLLRRLRSLGVRVGRLLLLRLWRGLGVRVMRLLLLLRWRGLGVRMGRLLLLRRWRGLGVGVALYGLSSPRFSIQNPGFYYY